MRIDIVAIGSRGDVQPFVALGVGLRMAGHSVRIVTLNGFEDLVCGRGLDHLAIGDSPQTIAGTEAGRQWIKDRSSTLGYLRGFVRLAAAKMEEGMARYWEAAHGTDVLIVSPMGLLVGVHIAERLRVPLIRAQVDPPSVPTVYDWDGHKSLAAAVQRGWAAFLDVSFHFLGWTALRSSTNAARQRILGLPPLPLLGWNIGRVPLLCGYSPAVVPRPPDFGDWIHVTGYWFLDDLPGWAPTGELVDFLAAGPLPVFIGFGSTPFPQPEATTDLVLRAVASAGHRGILVAGGSGLPTGRLSPEVLSVDSVPHEWLFPRVCAAVHHGGAGVTGAALRAGLPSVIVPVFADQPFWGNRVFRIGAAPPPIPAASLTEDKLAVAIRAATSGEMRHRAAALGDQIRKEDGVARAVEIVEKHFEKSAPLLSKHQYAH
jgi:UDP:flavonoid glycosyltransferase YjiC (YdhE family)